MNAPDLFELHQQMAHWAYAQAQAHPLESNAWLQVAYWAEAMLWMTPGVFVGWWCHWLMRGAPSAPHLHEHKGMRFERHHTGHWLQHLHDPQTAKLKTLEVHDGDPPGFREPEIVLNSPNQRLKSAR